MLFQEILNEKYKSLKPCFNDLFDLSIKNQTHSGDLLLVMENAVLGDEKDPDNPDNLKLYYNIGLDIEGHCESTNSEFIGAYVNDPNKISYQEYLKLHQYSPERTKEIDQIAFDEAISIQVEMLIYLKIWEGETFLKKWYELCRLISGEDYDWHFKIQSSGQKVPGGLQRYDIFKTHIKEKLKKHIPQLYDSFTKSHKSQIRNAIAHSQYAILGRNITLNNFKKQNADHVNHLTFDEWVDVFHETIVLFTLYLEFFQRVKEYYYNLTKPFKLKKEIRVNRFFPFSTSYLTVLHSREYFKDWSPYSNSKYTDSILKKEFNL